ncbi:hypothetical protein ACFPIJ_54175 [Dactylosporangium cerinum]|uniref:Transposase n=1 Tax=Dactylosporangium cerinum TaxID=1434730 RepID=A0ABV9WDD7_9ACTN
MTAARADIEANYVSADTCDHRQVSGFFEGLELVEPGIVPISE